MPDFHNRFRRALYGDLRAAWTQGFTVGFIMGGLTMVVCLLMFSCRLPTEPDLSDGCRSEAAFCADKTLNPLPSSEVRHWEDEANAFVTATYGEGATAYPRVKWHACFFTVNSVCAAGWTESRNSIHVSTAEPARTGPLIAHETIHAIYLARFGNADAHHRRPYGW